MSALNGKLPSKPLSADCAYEAPICSIIIPVYNKLEYTSKCLGTLFVTTGCQVPFEVIVVNNGSADGTAEFLSGQLEVLTIITNNQNLGFAKACNQGAEVARGDYLLFLNNDTVVTPGWLEELLDACNLDVGIVGCRMLYPDYTIQHAGIELIAGIPDHPYRHQPADLPAANTPRDLDMVTGACLLIKRELFLMLGGFDEVYRNGVEDVDLCLRVREAGYRVVYQPRAMIYHHEGQSSGRFDHVDHNLRFFFNRWQGKFDSQGRFKAANPPIIMIAEKSYINEQRLHVVWQGSQFVYHSLALVNRELTIRLIHKGHELSIVPYEPDDFTPESDSPFAAIQTCVNKPLSQPVDAVIRHQWPPDFNPPPIGHWVMIQPWEYGSLPQAWIRPMNDELDEIWVPSSYVRECYIQSGVSSGKVFVVPNGVDTVLYSPGGATYPIASGKSFRFLFVGGTIHRKGIDLLLAAYRRSFTAQDDVCLVIKDMGGKSFYQGQTAQEMIKRFSADPAAPEIVYIDSNLSQDEMAALYRSCHCLVQPYRGEGFGLPIAEGMASGLSVIVTGYGAALDFCPPDIAWLVPAHEVHFATRCVGDIDTVGLPWLAEPNLDMLANCMNYAFNHPDEVQSRGRAACAHIREHFTWDHAARCVEARLQELRTKPVVRFAKEKPSSIINDTIDAVADEEAKRRDLAGRVIEQARILHLRGDIEAAVALLVQQGIGTAPKWQAPYLALTELLISEQRFEDALQVLPEMPTDTDNAMRSEIEAICHSALGNDEKAQQASRLAQGHPRALVVLGTLEARRGYLAGAEELFRRAIEVDPSCGGAWLSLGMLLWSQGNQEDAWRAMKRSVIVDPLNEDAVKILQDMAERSERLSEIVKLIGEAVQAHPDSRNLRAHYAKMLARCGQAAEALDASEVFLVRFGVDEELLSLALQVRHRIGTYNRLAEAGTQSISLCMIVKNEENNLAACLASLKPVVDEMIVVDTGSTDRTADIAAAFGAKICTFAWNGNFSDARNCAINEARGKWVLVMDADEVLAAQDFEAVRHSVCEGSGKKIVWSVLTRNYTTRVNAEGWISNDGAYPCEERAGGWHPSWKVRLFPNQPDIRFKGEVHEMVEHSLQMAGFTIKKAGFVVHHFGGLVESVEEAAEKGRRYFEIGMKKLDKNPYDAGALVELAVQASEIGSFEEAIRLWDRLLENAPENVEALFNKGYALIKLQRYQEALDISEKVLALAPDHKEAAFNYGTSVLYVGKPVMAVQQLEPLLKHYPEYPPLLAVLTLLYLVSGQREKAVFTYSKLKTMNYAVTDYANARADVLARLGKEDMARKLLDECTAIGILQNSGVQK